MLSNVSFYKHQKGSMCALIQRLQLRQRLQEQLLQN